jgi:hypothetical protein
MLKKQRIQADANSARLETHHDSHVQSAPLPAHRPGHSTNHALGLTYPATTTFPTPTHAGRCMWCCSCHAAEFWGGLRGGAEPPPASSCHCCRTVHNYINRDHPTAPIATTGPCLPHTHHDFTISRRCRTNGLLGSRNTPAPFSLVHNINARVMTSPGRAGVRAKPATSAQFSRRRRWLAGKTAGSRQPRRAGEIAGAPIRPLSLSAHPRTFRLLFLPRGLLECPAGAG